MPRGTLNIIIIVNEFGSTCFCAKYIGKTTATFFGERRKRDNFLNNTIMNGTLKLTPH